MPFGNLLEANSKLDLSSHILTVTAWVQREPRLQHRMVLRKQRAHSNVTKEVLLIGSIVERDVKLGVFAEYVTINRSARNVDNHGWRVHLLDSLMVPFGIRNPALDTLVRCATLQLRKTCIRALTALHWDRNASPEAFRGSRVANWHASFG